MNAPVRTLIDRVPMSQQRKVLLQAATGLHARPAMLLAQKAQSFKSSVRLKTANREVDAKSILELLTLAAEKGAELTLQAEGEDEVEAVDSLADFLTRVGA